MTETYKILVLCTGNSCRSQMAEAFLKSFNSNLIVHSAGTIPEEKVHPKAIQVMNEIGIDLFDNYPKNVEIYLDESFDYVITVCNNAKETCPVFTGKVIERLHFGFEDPSEITGTDEEIIFAFRKARDTIKNEMYTFYNRINL